MRPSATTPNTLPRWPAAHRSILCRHMEVRRSLVFLVALLATPLACSSSTEPKRVVGIGDSLMLLAAPNIQQALASDHEVTIIAKNGRRIDEMLPPLRRALREEAPVEAVIANLGTNNVLQGATYTEALDDFDRLITLTKSVPCVILTTVSTRVDSWRGNSVGAEINAKIQDVRNSDPRQYQVADWDAAVRSPAGFATLLANPEGISDGVHENATAGRQWFADQYADALSRCPSGSP